VRTENATLFAGSIRPEHNCHFPRIRREFSSSERKMKISVVAPIALVALAIAAGGGYWFGAQRTDAGAKGAPTAGAPSPDKGAPSAVAVEVVTAVTAPMPQMISAVGSLRSDESVTRRNGCEYRRVARAQPQTRRLKSELFPG
jgi:hypothetical protein